MSATILLAGYVASGFYGAASSNKVNDIHGPSLIGVAHASPLNPNERRALIAQLGRAPLNQYLFNLLFVDSIAHNSWSDDQKHKAENILARLGYRRLAAQKNLIALAAARGDTRLLVDRLDALLRRTHATERKRLFSIALLVESQPQWHGAWVQKLAANPPWATEYMTAASLLATPVQLAARARVIRALDGAVASREYYTTVSEAALAQGDEAHAARNWQNYVLLHEDRRAWSGLTGFDETASSAAMAPGQESKSLSPFDWHRIKTFGTSTHVTEVNVQGVRIAIMWNGTGTPVFLSRRLAGLSNLTSLPAIVQLRAGRSDQIALRIRCGKTIISQSGLLDRPGVLPKQAPCAAPVAEVIGIQGAIARPLEAVLLLPVSAPRQSVKFGFD